VSLVALVVQVQDARVLRMGVKSNMSRLWREIGHFAKNILNLRRENALKERDLTFRKRPHFAPKKPHK